MRADPAHIRHRAASALPAAVDPSDPLALSRENRRLHAELRAKGEALRTARLELAEVESHTRRRIERDLHDGAQQRLVSLALNLALLSSRVDAQDFEAARELLDGSREDLDQALDELRELARGVHPAVLAERGLGAAIDSLARGTPLPVDVSVATDARHPEPIEQAAYFVVSEALTNVVRHAMATRAEVSVATNDGAILVEVRDDGAGGAAVESGSGLRGLAGRLDGVCGELEVESPPGEGTTVRARIPREEASLSPDDLDPFTTFVAEIAGAQPAPAGLATR